MTDHHTFGNGHADRLVKFVSKYFHSPNDAANPIVRIIALTKKIQLKLAAVLCNLPHRRRHGRPPKPVPVPRPSIQDLVAGSVHSLLDSSSAVFKCTVCLGTCSKASPHLRSFLAGECVPSPIDHTRGYRVGQVSINGTPTHPSHTLVCIGGCFCCSKCGFYGDKKLVKLRDACVGPGSRTHHGDVALSVAAQGVPPFKRFITNVATDRVVKAKPSCPAASSQCGVPLGYDAFAVKISDLHPSGQPACRQAPQEVPQLSPEEISRELFDLQQVGEKVVIPHRVPALPGVSSAPAASSSYGAFSHHSQIFAPPPSPPPSGFSNNLADLADLRDDGEPVEWPKGFNRAEAIQFVEDAKQARVVGRLYRKFPP